MRYLRFLCLSIMMLIYIGLSSITRIVDISGSGQYTSIQTAINASASGDTVLVYPGTYNENLIVSSSGITIMSLEGLTNEAAYIDSTIINGRNLSSGLRVNQNVLNITIQGFSIVNSKCGVSGGQNSSMVIKNCEIYNNASVNAGGVSVYKGTAYLSGVSIHDNYAHNMGGGLYVNGYMGTVNVTFDPVNRCSIYNNRARAGQDILAHSINTDLNIPLDMFTVANATTYYATPLRADGNEFQLSLDIQRAHHEEINSNFYVSPYGDDGNDGLTPATALRTINNAIYKVASDSLNQKTVHILPGVYSRTANQQVFPIALKSWVKIVGSGIDETEIIGEPDPNYASIPDIALFVFSSFYQSNVTLKDLSITSAGSDNSCALTGFDEDYLNIQNVRMHGLSPDLVAVIDISYTTNSLWDGLIIEDISTDNSGMFYIDGGFTGTIKNSTFRNATSTFVSTEIWASPLIWVEVGEELIIENSVFSDITMLDDDSQAIQFGGMYNPPVQPQYTMQNCLFSNINCNVRGVILHGEDYPLINISNCTFAGQNGNGEALMVNGIVSISNCVFYNNRSKEIAINPMDGSGITTTLTLNNNLIRNGFGDIWQAPGNTINYNNTNITGNPYFEGGDDIHDPLYYSLSELSPCIDTGTPDITGLDLPPYDLAWNWRVWNGHIDMGCYEFGSEPWVSIDDPVVPVPDEVMSVYPNPFRGFANIRVELDDAMQNARIEVYNLRGQKVKSIALDASGKGQSYWDGRDDSGKLCANGVYVLSLSIDNKVIQSKRVTLLK